MKDATVTRWQRPASGLVLLVALLTGAAAYVRYLPSPLRFDEMEFARMGIGTLHHGVPKLLYQEENARYPSSYQEVNGRAAHYGMWHPPVYLYSLAAAVALLGPGNATFRLVGVAYFGLTLFFGWLILCRFTPGASAEVRLAGISLLLLCPLLLEGSVYLDIDNTCLAFALTLLSWLFVRAPEDVSPRNIGFLALAIAFALSTKLTTPFIFIASVVTYHLLDRQPLRALLQGVLPGALGLAVFALAYWSYCNLFNYPTRFMFDLSYAGKRGMYTSLHSLLEIAASARWHLVWISPGWLLLLGGGLVAWAARFVKTWRMAPEDFLLVFALAVLAAYVVLGAMVGKYTFGGVVAGLLYVAIRAIRSLSSTEVLRPWWLLGAVVVLACVHLAAVPVLQWKRPWLTGRSGGLVAALGDARNLSLLFAVATLLVFLAVTWRWMRGTTWDRLCVLGVAYILAANSINQVKTVVTEEDRSPYRPLQERGFEELLTFLRTRTSPGETLLSAKDVGYYFHGPYYAIDMMSIFAGPASLDALVENGSVGLVVDSLAFPELPTMASFVARHRLEEVAQLGNFVVYQVPSARAGRSTEPQQ